MTNIARLPERILVIKFRHIGDVLLTAPLISTLKLGIPGSRVCAVVKPGTEIDERVKTFLNRPIEGDRP